MQKCFGKLPRSGAIDAAGEHVNEHDYKKHKNAVFRLLQIVNPDVKIKIDGLVRESVERFLSIMENELVRTEQLGLVITKDKAIEELKTVYLE